MNKAADRKLGIEKTEKLADWVTLSAPSEL